VSKNWIPLIESNIRIVSYSISFPYILMFMLELQGKALPMYNCTCVLVSFIREPKINHLIGSIDSVQGRGKKAMRLYSRPEAAAIARAGRGGTSPEAVVVSKLRDRRRLRPPKARTAKKKLKENSAATECKTRSLGREKKP
jgi:hypothetical protein